MSLHPPGRGVERGGEVTHPLKQGDDMPFGRRRHAPVWFVDRDDFKVLATASVEFATKCTICRGLQGISHSPGTTFAMTRAAMIPITVTKAPHFSNEIASFDV